jgi:HSP20 family protein
MEVFMNITRWDPFRELQDMSQRLNSIFARPFDGGLGRELLTVAEWSPAVDVSETDAEYVVKAELPEVKKDDVKVTMEDGVLTLQGERKQEKEEKGKRYHRIERSYGSFMRSFDLPENVDSTKAKAEFKDGMLTLSLPKTEKAKSKSLEIKVS